MSDLKNKIMHPFFITGMMRSGTSLLAELLNTQPQITCTSQKYTDSFLKLKKEFNVTKNIDDYHVLNNLFKEARYAPSDFIAFLEHRNFKETYSKNLPIKSKESIYSGNKEILCEEYIGYFIRCKIKCILIIRDPRDIITSLNYGRHQEFTGNHRPILFDLRNWRKSIHHHILHHTNKNILTVKYEDLVLNPLETLNKITSFLEVRSFTKPEELKIQGNSSHENYSSINTRSVGIYKKLLGPNIISYIEQICSPEMIYANYLKEFKHVSSVIQNFNEPFSIKRPEFVDFMESTKDHVIDELKRIELLYKKDITEQEVKKYFSDVAIYDSLKKGL